MKKLTILMLVLGLTTVANAQLTGVQLSVNGVTNGPGNTTEFLVCLSTEVVIDVYGPADYNWVGYVVINGNPPAAGEWGDNLAPPSVPGYYVKSGYPIKYPSAGDDLASVHRFEFAGWGFGYEVCAAQVVGPILGGREFDFMYHQHDTGAATITLWDDSAGYSSPQDTVVIYEIPEPMTIALLGLGGMALLRKRR
ncbi:MAG: PEP-CTERM sorting domain-containing protein [Sedimentisphaerales bacterium]|nr:PEP-CTERM sorting domain-containing protein [Sedimentisphaerales bacterium]